MKRVHERYPNKHVWVDKMRYWIKVSDDQYDEKTQDEHIKWSTFHDNQREEVE